MSLSDTLKSLRYVTPPGKVDVPFAYVYNATALTDGQSYNFLSQQIDGDSDFILRRIAGTSLVADSFRPYYASRAMMFQSLVKSVANWPVLPEAFYPRNSQILFDLGNVNRAFNVSGGEPNLYVSYIAFEGVRRYDVDQFPVYKTPYDYRELPRTYTVDNFMPGPGWTDAASGIMSASTIQSIPLTDGDFELFNIGVVRMVSRMAPTTEVFQLRLYDGRGWFRHAQRGFNSSFFNNLAPQTNAAPAVAAWYRPNYPAVSVVYPENGVIKFEIQSTQPFASAAARFQLTFNGVQRQRNGSVT